RLAVFVIIWLVSFGKHHLWLLPNLTEDVGFIESFWPLYKYEFKGQKDKNGEKEEKPIQTKETTEDKEESTTDQEGKESEDQVHSESEKDSEVERDRIERENGDNGFEILDPCEELDQDKKDKPTVDPKQDIQEESKPTKVEYAIAKYLRDKLPAKKTTLLSHKVEYFIGNITFF
ncbi:translocation protein SEC62-like, partial [Centruroides sculpturatus]|uniref:translocation protein SEC62-like n=1 Tax=Centruroides sculpturatus TaxID=218467 RepID=UPI000C6DB85E